MQSWLAFALNNRINKYNLVYLLITILQHNITIYNITLYQ